MTVNRLTEALQRDEVLLGVSNSYPATGILESMCRGWDFVWIDGQHGQMDYQAALHAVQTAASMDVASVVRVPGDEASILGPWADLGPWAIMVPMVNTPEQAATLAQRLHFPPLGQRSIGGLRPVDRHGRHYYKDAPQIVIAQIETPEAVENAHQIVQTPGIDALFLGATDLKVQMGLDLDLPVTASEALEQAMARTAQAARSAGKWAGCIAAGQDAVTLAMEMGYQMLVGGGDISLIRSGAARLLQEMKQATEK